MSLKSRPVQCFGKYIGGIDVSRCICQSNRFHLDQFACEVELYSNVFCFLVHLRIVGDSNTALVVDFDPDSFLRLVEVF